MAKKVETNDLLTGTMILLKGDLEFSKLSKKYIGKELEEKISRTEAVSGYPIYEPHVTVTIKNTKIVGFNVQEKPQNYDQKAYKKKIATFIKERLYHSQKGDYKNGYSIARRYYINNFIDRHRDNPNLVKKGQLTKKGWDIFAKDNLPAVYFRTEDEPNVLNKVNLKDEIAKDSSVILVLRIYESSSKKGRNKGLSLDGVIVNGEIKYFTSNQEDRLSEFGFVIKDQTQDEKYDDFADMNEEEEFEKTFNKKQRKDEGILSRPKGYEQYEEDLGYNEEYDDEYDDEFEDYSEDWEPYEGENPYHSNERQGIVTEEDDDDDISSNGFMNAF